MATEKALKDDSRFNQGVVTVRENQPNQKSIRPKSVGFVTGVECDNEGAPGPFDTSRDADDGAKRFREGNSQSVTVSSVLICCCSRFRLDIQNLVCRWFYVL